MFLLRIVGWSLRRQSRRRLLISVTVGLATAVCVAMLGIVFDVQDKLSEQLAAYGSNITVRPKSDAVVSELYETEDDNEGAFAKASTALLNEDDARNIKTIFWAYNITNFAPRLDTSAAAAASGGRSGTVPIVGTWFSNTLHLDTGESTVAGVSGMRTWWKLDGRWPQDGTDQAVVGARLARTLGISASVIAAQPQTVSLEHNGVEVRVQVVGVFSANDGDDDAVYTSTAVAQRLARRPGKVGSIEVKALTTPENDLARRASRNPAMLSQEEWETWYCTAYASSIAYQIEEAIPGAVARQVRQVSALQDEVMTKTRAVMIVMTVLCLVASAVAVANLTAATIGERSGELALLKAVGASDGAVGRLLLAETAVVSVVGMLAGGAAGVGVAQMIGRIVFGTGITLRPMVLLFVAVLMAGTVLLSSLTSIRSVVRLQPAQVLHGR
ncbi:ABC transporter permease [Bifidobacterium animalis subsp. animalis]|nr:ABC transporter permease [Bifidobacterium animalis subsp. animalis]